MSERVLICGDRYWDDYNTIVQALSKIQQEKGVEVVIEGEADGADSMGRQAAIQLGIPVLKFPADWRRYAHNAGPMRNIQMLQEGRPTLVLAFHNYIENSKGTKHMVNAARQAAVPTEIISTKKRRQSGKEIKP